MLTAIAIYQFDSHEGSQKKTKIAFAQKAPLFGFGLFEMNELGVLETKTLPLVSSYEKDALEFIHFEQRESGEHHYVKRITHDNQTYLFTMVSRKKLDEIEARYLFINMWHAFKRGTTAQITLQNIINNPLGYTGRDCLLETTKQAVADLKQEMLNTLDIVIERGEQLETLRDKTIKLEETSKLFEDEAKKLNSGCCAWRW